MKVIPPSFEILENLDRESLAFRIEACGRVCYKSEDKITDASTEPFIRNIIRRAHNSVLEMGVFSLQVTIDTETLANQFFQTMPKYLVVDRLEKQVLLITGSVRAFREMYQNYSHVKLIKAITAFLSEANPLFFADLEPKRGWVPQSGVDVEKFPLEQVDALSVDLLGRHRFLGVKFYVNRAITHEIVRHRPCSYLQESQRYCRYGESKFGSEVTFIKPLFYDEQSKEYVLWKEAMEATEKIYMNLLETSSPQAARTVLPNSCKTELITYANLIEWFHIFKLRTSPAAEPTMREIMIPLLDVFKEKFPSVFSGLAV